MHKQRDIIYHLSNSKSSKENTKWYLIDHAWWQEWCRYTGYFRLNTGSKPVLRKKNIDKIPSNGESCRLVSRELDSNSENDSYP